MVWDGPAETPVLSRIVALAPSLQPTERRVVEAIAADASGTVERTAQEVADLVGVGRASVIRAAQSLGYGGYPQLRVALAQGLVREGSAWAAQPQDGTMVGALRAGAQRFALRVGDMLAALSEQVLQDFVHTITDAERVLVVANGLSAPLGLDLMLRLNSIGRPAEHLADAVAQQISARQLSANDVCVVISGSGANRTTLETITAARGGAAQVLVLTSFARSAVVDAADQALVVPPVNESFRDELVHTSRVALLLVIEGIVDQVLEARGDRGRAARAAAISVLGDAIRE